MTEKQVNLMILLEMLTFDDKAHRSGGFKEQNLLNGGFKLRSCSTTESADKMTELVAMHLFDDEHAKPTSSK